MKVKVAILGALGLVAGLLGIAPAQAQTADPPVGIIIFQGTGWVCGSGHSTMSQTRWSNLRNNHPDPPPRRVPSSSHEDPQDVDSVYGPFLNNDGIFVDTNDGTSTGSGPTPRPAISKCFRWSDPIWEAASNVVGGSVRNREDGLFAPGFGPPMVGPYRLSVSPGLPDPGGIIDPNQSGCVTNVVVPGAVDGSGSPTHCTIESYGWLTPASISGTGAHAFTSKGRGWSQARAIGANSTTTAFIAWQQSAATILPLIGAGTTQSGGSSQAVAVVGFTSSRSGGTGTGNAGLLPQGVSDGPIPTMGFVTEGMTVSFPQPQGWPGAIDPLR